MIFQPDGETMESALAMVADGFSERFPVDAVYRMHPYLGSEYFAFMRDQTIGTYSPWWTAPGGTGSIVFLLRGKILKRPEKSLRDIYKT